MWLGPLQGSPCGQELLRHLYMLAPAVCVCRSRGTGGGEMVAVVLESGAAFPPWFLLISAPFPGRMLCPDGCISAHILGAPLCLYP